MFLVIDMLRNMAPVQRTARNAFANPAESAIEESGGAGTGPVIRSHPE